VSLWFNIYACVLAAGLANTDTVWFFATSSLLTMDSKALPLCPDKPNCVSSQAKESGHFVDPLSYTGAGREAFERLKQILSTLPNTRITDTADTQLHAEFRTRWFKFTDDFHAILDDERKVIEIRSASRVGYWDLGTNRRRVEMIRRLLAGQRN
jgi:uncharacterized protein (DUF1499 family)